MLHQQRRGGFLGDGVEGIMLEDDVAKAVVIQRRKGLVQPKERELVSGSGLGVWPTAQRSSAARQGAWSRSAATSREAYRAVGCNALLDRSGEALKMLLYKLSQYLPKQLGAGKPGKFLVESYKRQVS